MPPSVYYRELYPLKNRTILITGVSRREGIGCAAACQAAAWGASVAIHHFQPHDDEQPWGRDNLSAVKDAVLGELTEGARFTEIHADFREAAAPSRVIDSVSAELGVIDALVCNHAVSGSDGALGGLTAAMLDHHWAVNTRSSLLLAQSFTEQFPENNKNGRLIFMTSGQRQGPMPGEIGYTASKGALADVTLTIADQLADKGITVNTVNPGPVDTGYLNEETWQNIAAKFPFGRFGSPEDPARLIAWLLTNEAAWITGQIINTEGGFARWR